MRKTIKFISLLLLLLFSFSLTVSAEDGEFVTWQLSDGVLKGDEKQYTYYELPVGYDIEYNYFYYENTVTGGDGMEYEVIGASKDSEVVYLSNYFYEQVFAYATPEGQEMLDRYIGGEYSYLKFIDYANSEYTDLDSALLEKLDAIKNKGVSFPASGLKNTYRFDLVFFDSEEILAHSHGAVYGINDDLYYINYDELDNTYFDSNGNFSYRGNTVMLQKLEGDLLTEVEDLLDKTTYYEYNYQFEDDSFYEDGWFEEFVMTPEVAVAILSVLIAVIGIALPLVPLIILTVKLLKRKVKHIIPVYISIVSISIWLASGIAMMILILV